MSRADLPFEPSSERFLVGLEIHQQLASPSKLFCSCPVTKSTEFPKSFERRLRPAQSEVGAIDPATVFEFNKDKMNAYEWNPGSSCLVEADEEPPHSLKEDALDTAILLATMLESNVVDEVHVMRKIVIDGSNTSGFQRTAIVALGGSLRTEQGTVGVQALTLEEDAARITGEDERSRHFALDRLGVPLVEVSLDPIVGDPSVVESVALHLGRTMRTSGRVARGLGTIRQDLNISLRGGAVVEVKGVQKLNLLGKVVRYEAARQMGLVKIAEVVRTKGAASAGNWSTDITAIAAKSGSEVLKRVAGSKGVVHCAVLVGMAGLLGYEPFPGIRLGREFAEIARANSLGGVIHSDEFRKQKVGEPEELEVRETVGASPGDALVLIAGPKERVERVAALILERSKASSSGVPAETRAATEEGETRFLRPRPGAARLYPETDVPEIVVTGARKKKLATGLPPPWEAKVRRYEEDYGLSRELAMRVFDSDSGPQFERLSKDLVIEPSVVATVLVEIPVRLSREGVGEERMAPETLEALLMAIAGGSLAKEAAVDVLRLLGTGDAGTVEEAISKLGLGSLDHDQLVAIIDEVIATHASEVAEMGEERAFGLLMGEAMRTLRGRADGAVLSSLLKERLAATKKKPRKSRTSKDT